MNPTTEKKHGRLLAALLLALGTGCAPDPGPTAEVARLRADVAALQAQVNALAQNVDTNTLFVHGVFEITEDHGRALRALLPLED